MTQYLTGKKRVRVENILGKTVLILQVQYAYGSSPITGWRDADVKDISVELELELELMK